MFQSIKDILNMLKLSCLWPMNSSLSWLQSPSEITLVVFKSFIFLPLLNMRKYSRLILCTSASVLNPGFSPPKVCIEMYQNILNFKLSKNQHLLDRMWTTSRRKIPFSIFCSAAIFSMMAYYICSSRFWWFLEYKARSSENQFGTGNESGVSNLIPRFEKLCRPQQVHQSY